MGFADAPVTVCGDAGGIVADLRLRPGRLACRALPATGSRYACGPVLDRAASVELPVGASPGGSSSAADAVNDAHGSAGTGAPAQGGPGGKRGVCGVYLLFSA